MNILIGWIQSFLSDRLQHANVNGALTDVIEKNMKAPQGCLFLQFSLLYAQQIAEAHQNM